MNILTILHSLIIGPLKLFFDVIFSVANRFLNNPGLSIIFLSLAMNFLVLPLYMRADAMQEEERDVEAKMKPWVDHIKSAFKGDERFMMLQTYYRQVGYKQTDALKGSLSLLLEVPFFIAAYQFLSSLSILKGVSFGPIADLGNPDALITIGGISINILPILMTLINFVSGALYSKGFPLKSKIQIYGIAVIFLVFLYQSPSGLVFYWTLNNVFSLVKNVFYKLKHPGKVLCVLSAVCGAALLILAFVRPFSSLRREAFIIVLGVALIIPLIVMLIRSRKQKAQIEETAITAADKRSFFAGAIYLSVFIGLTISSTVINSSPAEFINVSEFRNPVWYAVNSFAMAIGTFVVWCGIFYMLAGNRIKKIMQAGIWVVAVCGTVDYLFFGTKLGTLLTSLKYEQKPDFTWKQQLLNLVIIIAVAAAAFLLFKWKSRITEAVLFVGAAAMLIMGAYNLIHINSVAAPIKAQIEASKEDVAKITLSKTGKNVIVMMLDRAIGMYIPYMINERPELKEQFSGFTYYANTISYGHSTNVGAPVLFGGYEYTPVNMNARSDMLLVDKHNEALKVMPVLFNENGFEVTVCDPPYANYAYIPDLSIYDDYPEINTYLTEGKFNSYNSLEQMEVIYKRNFFCYGLFKAAPLVLQEALYNSGNYNTSETGQITADVVGEQTLTGKYTSEGLSSLFMDSYSVLESLVDLTEITDEDKNTFLMMANDTTHMPTLLQEPDYVPAVSVDNTAYEESHADRFTVDGRTMNYETSDQITHYHVNISSFIQLGKWMDYLKENGVYDNTRIIFAGDHGRGLHHFNDLVLENNRDTVLFDPLLIVKDFDEEEFKINYDFMTIGDIPAMATADIIENPVNPFTGHDLQDTSPKEGKQMITITDWHTDINNGYTFAEGDWYSVHDNIFDINNWKIESLSGLY